MESADASSMYANNSRQSLAFRPKEPQASKIEGFMGEGEQRATEETNERSEAGGGEEAEEGAKLMATIDRGGLLPGEPSDRQMFWVRQLGNNYWQQLKAFLEAHPYLRPYYRYNIHMEAKEDSAYPLALCPQIFEMRCGSCIDHGDTCHNIDGEKSLRCRACTIFGGRCVYKNIRGPPLKREHVREDCGRCRRGFPYEHVGGTVLGMSGKPILDPSITASATYESRNHTSVITRRRIPYFARYPTEAEGRLSRRIPLSRRPLPPFISRRPGQTASPAPLLPTRSVTSRRSRFLQRQERLSERSGSSANSPPLMPDEALHEFVIQRSCERVPSLPDSSDDKLGLEQLKDLDPEAYWKLLAKREAKLYPEGAFWDHHPHRQDEI